MKIYFKEFYNNNKVILGFYLGMFVQMMIIAFVEGRKDNYIALISSVITVVICIIILHASEYLSNKLINHAKGEER